MTHRPKDSYFTDRRYCSSLSDVRPFLKSIHEITLTIRKFHTKHFTIADLIENGTLNAKTAEFLRERVSNRQNILISGGTGSGKTTLLNILARFHPR